VAVIVETVERDAEAAGLSTQRILSLVETQLRRSKVVLAKDTKDPKASGGFVYVNLVYRPNGLSNVQFNLTVQYRQPVALLRDTQIALYAATWQDGVSAVSDRQGAVAFVREALEGRLDNFINDYQKANE
jgi:uncharacterized protein (UPF0261 family)